MKTNKLFLATALLLAAASGRTQNYQLNWFNLDAGGGVSGGESFIVSGTLGQPASSKSLGGIYSLSGGFSTILAAIQTTNAPRLALRREQANLVISWPVDPSNWILESTSSLSLAWTPAGLSLKTNDLIIIVTIPIPTGNRFYRLHKP
jgi:hypothetical protein